MSDRTTSPFNSPLEAGLRALAVLAWAHPAKYDLQRLVEFDYLTVHSGDADGPESLHAPVPLRSGELLVRRGLVERGLLLMVSRNLLLREASPEGFFYFATERTAPFLESLGAIYTNALRDRADWAVTNFGGWQTSEVAALTSRLLRHSQFEASRRAGTLL